MGRRLGCCTVEKQPTSFMSCLAATTAGLERSMYPTAIINFFSSATWSSTCVPHLVLCSCNINHMSYFTILYDRYMWLFISNCMHSFGHGKFIHPASSANKHVPYTGNQKTVNFEIRPTCASLSTSSAGRILIGFSISMCKPAFAMSTSIALAAMSRDPAHAQSETVYEEGTSYLLLL